jgi:acyl-CoA synthetase (NDP forming)
LKASSEDPKKIIASALLQGRSALLETEAEHVSRYFGLRVPRSGLARTEAEALKLSQKIGFPVVMKIVSPDILHKSDVGGVVPNITTSSLVRESFRAIIRNAKKSNSTVRIEGVLVQKMAEKTFEFVVGGIRDPQFGPLVMFGLGGIYIELFKDVAFRLAPVTRMEARSMMAETKSSRLLTGFRGSKPLDQGSAGAAVSSVGKMMTSLKEIESIDINPLLVYPKGAIAVDVRIVLRKSS